MSRKINFCLGFHMNQPVGNFESIFAQATARSYRNLLDAFINHPQIPFALHVSGSVLEYFEQKHADIMQMIADMVERGQCELLGGGFYEPILQVIPTEDAIGQIEMMNYYLYEKFGAIPNGIWLAERVWETSLPSLLAKAGVKFLAVDDCHLKAVGIHGDDLLAYFMTEDDGKPIAIFPISELLRYIIPFGKVVRTIDYLHAIASEAGDRLIVFADNAEKFGLWPGTKRWVWEHGWMDRFLTALEENSDWIQLMSFSTAMDRLEPMRNIYMPAGSYFEMGEWTLPADMSYDFYKLVRRFKDSDELEKMRPFIRGGFWRNFLTKYPESNWMHKRMLWISRRLSARKGKIGKSMADARRALYRAQCNCAYWHGVFGGLYLPHLREGVWKNIIEAERIAEKKAPTKAVIVEDVNADGKDEIRMCNGEAAVWIIPHNGGAIAELDFLPTATNLTNTLSRHREGYHSLIGERLCENDDVPISGEKELKKVLHYDYRRRLFAQDHFLFTYTTGTDMERSEYVELGDFIDKPYDIIKMRKARGDTEVMLERKGALHFEGRNYPLTMGKRISLSTPGNRIAVQYEIENRSDWREFLFAVETNYSLQSRDDPSRYFLFPHETLNRVSPGARRTFVKVDGYELIDEKRGYRVSCRADSDRLWLFPIETISSSQAGFERLFQETALIHVFRFDLGNGEKFNAEIIWRIEKL